MKVIEEIAALLARHKLVPFLGAGVSRAQLGFAAPGLKHRLAAALPCLPPEKADLAQVADALERHAGLDSLVTELLRYLHCKEFDDALSATHLLVISLECGLVYTTNQDNLFELIAEKYHRPHRTVLTLTDLAEADPGEKLYIKFHGDPTVPKSLVFTQSSYLRRMAEPDNFLDIRLRSDLLGRGLLFIGYSLQDENLRGLLRQTQRAYHGGTPKSYLIAFDYQPEMESVTAEFGVTVVNPRSLFLNEPTNASAFERCLDRLAKTTRDIKTQGTLDTLFSKVLPVPIVMERELVELEQVAVGASLAAGIKAFRVALDAAQVSPHLQRRVAEVFVTLAEKLSNEAELPDLKAALFNLHIAPEHALLAMAGYMAATNVRNPASGFDDTFIIVSACMREDMWPIAAAHAVGMLLGGGYTIGDGFRQLAMHWFEDLDGLSVETREFVEKQVRLAWDGCRCESPLARAARLGPLARPFRKRKFGDLGDEIARNWPQQFPLPDRTL